MKTEKDYYYQKLFSVSDKPINLLNPDRDKSVPLNASNETEKFVEDIARINYEQNLFHVGKYLKVKMWCFQIVFIIFLSTITSLIPCIKIQGPNPDWQKYIALYVLVALPSFDIGLALYRMKARRNEIYFNLHAINLLPDYEKTIRWETFVEDLKIAVSSDESLRPFLITAEAIKFPRHGTEVHSCFHQKKLAEKVGGCSNYETTKIIPNVLSIIVLVASFALQLYLSISDVLETDSTNVQRVIQVIVFPTLLSIVFVLGGFLYGSIRLERELKILELAYVYGGYCANPNVEWKKVGVAKENVEDYLPSYLDFLCYEARKSGIQLRNCQIRLSLIEGEYVIESTSEKYAENLRCFLLTKQANHKIKAQLEKGSD